MGCSKWGIGHAGLAYGSLLRERNHVQDREEEEKIVYVLLEKYCIVNYQ
jgi:hypothetical protein